MLEMTAAVNRLYLWFSSHLKPIFNKALKFIKFSARNFSKEIVNNPARPPYIRNSSNFLSNECDIFNGKWVVDESYPLYNASECPFAERGFDCLANGRKDKGYIKWRWKPKNCEIPRFDVHKVLEMLRGKRVVFVGDSLSRTQWESMICMLMAGVEDKNSVYEVNKNQITKQIRYLAVRFSTFNFTVEFYRSIFLVQPGSAPRHSPKRVKTVLMLDPMDDISKEWIDSDILIFNSGHWWTSTKLFELSGTRQNCKVTRQPSAFNIKQRQRSSISDAIITAVKNVSVPVQLLHVTPMGAFRSDAHVGSWSDNPSVPDCSHWCLPGVPDMWNELLFLFLLSQ